MSPLHAPGRIGKVRSGASPGSETLNPGAGRPGPFEEGVRPGAWEAINPSPAVYLMVQAPGRPSWCRACAGGETESPLIRGLSALLEVVRGAVLWTRPGQEGPPGRQCALCGVVSKGLSLGTGGGVGGHSTQLKGGKHRFLWPPRQVPRPCGRNPIKFFAWSEQNEGGRWGQVMDGVGASVRGGLRGALQARGKSLAFVLCYGMRECGEFGGAVFHCQRSTLVSLCVSHRPGCPGWRPETRSEAVAGAQVIVELLVGRAEGWWACHVLSGF